MCVRYQVKHMRKWELVSFFAELTACQVATRPILSLLVLSSSPARAPHGREACSQGGGPARVPPQYYSGDKDPGKKLLEGPGAAEFLGEVNVNSMGREWTGPDPL